MLKFIREPFDLEGKILLVNAISPGYVPTYTFDELIVLNNFKRVAFLESGYFEPSVGYLPAEIEGGALGLAGEVYVSGDVCLLQFRSVLRFGRKADFAKQIANLVRHYKFEDVVVVGSLPFQIKHDREIGLRQKSIYFTSKGVRSRFVPIEKCGEVGLATRLEVLKDEDEEEEVILSNGGLCGVLWKELERVVILMMFNEKLEDRETGIYFSKQLYKFVDKKELSRLL